MGLNEKDTESYSIQKPYAKTTLTVKNLLGGA